MESDNSKSESQKPIPKKNVRSTLTELKLVGRRSALLRSHLDTDNLDFDGRDR